MKYLSCCVLLMLGYSLILSSTYASSLEKISKDAEVEDINLEQRIASNNSVRKDDGISHLSFRIVFGMLTGGSFGGWMGYELGSTIQLHPYSKSISVANTLGGMAIGMVIGPVFTLLLDNPVDFGESLVHIHKQIR